MQEAGTVRSRVERLLELCQVPIMRTGDAGGAEGGAPSGAGVNTGQIRLDMGRFAAWVRCTTGASRQPAHAPCARLCSWLRAYTLHAHTTHALARATTVS